MNVQVIAIALPYCHGDCIDTVLISLKGNRSNKLLLLLKHFCT